MASVIGEKLGEAVEIPGLGTFLELLVKSAAPDFDEEAEESKQALKKLRQSYGQLTRGTYAEMLTNEINRVGDLAFPFMENDPNVGLYRDWVLGGWDDELDLLGFSILKIAF